MITEALFRRHVHAHGGDREVVLLDVAQEYILEHMRREGLFDGVVVFKGGTALRKFVFGSEGRFSTDLDFALVSDDPAEAEAVLNALDGAGILGVRIDLERRETVWARLRIDTALGPVTEPAAISIRTQPPWLPVVWRKPMPFEYLDQGLRREFTRSPLPLPDIRELAAEKIAAFWRRRHARDLYDLEHLGRVLQPRFDGTTIAALAALKIFFDVVDEGLGCPPSGVEDVFACAANEVVGASDLGRFRAAVTDVRPLLARCAQRYSVLPKLEEELHRIVTTCGRRDRFRALALRDSLISHLASSPRG